MISTTNEMTAESIIHDAGPQTKIHKFSAVPAGIVDKNHGADS